MQLRDAAVRWVSVIFVGVLILSPAAAPTGATSSRSQTVQFNDALQGSTTGSIPIPKVGAIGLKIAASVTLTAVGIIEANASTTTARQGTSATLTLLLKSGQGQGSVSLSGEFDAGQNAYLFSQTIPIPSYGVTQNLNIPLSPFTVPIPIYGIDITLTPSLGIQSSILTRLQSSNQVDITNPVNVTWAGLGTQSSSIAFNSDNSTVLSATQLTSRTKLNAQVGVGVYGLTLVNVPVLTIVQHDSSGTPSSFVVASFAGYSPPQYDPLLLILPAVLFPLLIYLWYRSRSHYSEAV